MDALHVHCLPARPLRPLAPLTATGACSRRAQVLCNNARGGQGWGFALRLGNQLVWLKVLKPVGGNVAKVTREFQLSWAASEAQKELAAPCVLGVLGYCVVPVMYHASSSEVALLDLPALVLQHAAGTLQDQLKERFSGVQVGHQAAGAARRCLALLRLLPAQSSRLSF
jgi:hypothetical protein